MKAPRLPVKSLLPLFLTLAAGAFCLPAPAAPRLQFTITDLGGLPGVPALYAYPRAINNRGQVAGNTLDTNGTVRPFLYSDGVMTEIPVPPGYGIANGINEAGVVVGEMSPFNGFVYRDGVVTDLNPLLGAPYSSAAGINNRGQIVGVATGPNGSLGPFHFGRGGMGFYALPTNNYLGIASAINNAGLAVGSVGLFVTPEEPNFHAALFQDGRVRDLGTLPGAHYSQALAINDRGDIAGWSGLDVQGPDARNFHAVIFRDGRLIDLGVLRGDIISGANALNNAGWVVGWSEDVQEHQRAILHVDGQLHDLNDLVKDRTGWTLSLATGVNDRGQIIGIGLVRDYLHGFLLTPQAGWKLGHDRER